MKKTGKKESPPAAISKGQLSDITITMLDEEGFACATDNEVAVKVLGALPGEQVRIKYVHVARNRGVAQLIKILRHSRDRLLSSPCPSSGSCDGCPLIKMKYSAQLAWKTEFLRRELARFFPVDTLDIRPIAQSPDQLHYRNSAKLVISGKFASPVIGIYRRNSHDVTDIEDCPLHHPLITKIVKATKAGIAKGKVPIYSARSESGLLRYLVVRVSVHENRAMVVLVTAERSYNEIHHLAKFIQSHVPEVAVVAQNVNSSTGNVILGPRDHFLTHQHGLTDTIGTTKFSISPRSFFQVNSGGARLIYEQVREFAELTGKERVIDVYCGVGGISLFLAPTAREVVGIEYVETAVADAERNAELNGTSNCRFMAGDAAELLDEMTEEKLKADVVVLNPPRKGCDESVLKSAANLAPARMIYVSCSPQSLARDLNILHRLRYTPRAIQPIDMFPQTPHMENVVLLVKGP